MPTNFSVNPLQTPLVIPSTGQLPKEWMSWFQQVSNAINGLYQYGTTAQRPTSNVYVGQMYFDTTLGYPVFVKTLASPIVWVNGAGTHV
jgi:predicted small integral membrane protein